MERHHIILGAFLLLFAGVTVVVLVCVSAATDSGNHGGDDDNLPFWKTGIVYQVYPRSFSDSDGDGTGDLKGIASRADHLQDLGVKVVWLSPVYESPMKDFGYDISNYTAIDPIFGTMEDFDHLMTELHDRGLKVVMDFVPNHTSDQHPWFKKSEKKEGVYTDYYVWADSKGNDTTGNPIPPNNWVSEFRGSAWQWSEVRKQFYYHEFLKEQPDLNYRSEHVREDMKDVLRFWLEKGVDGFRVDALKYLLEVEDLSLDEPPSDDNPEILNDTYTTNRPGTFQVLGEWRQLIDEYKDKVLMVEVYSDVQDVMKYYGNETDPLADFPFNFFMLDDLTNRSVVSGYSLKNTISVWLNNMPKGKWPNWVLGNHDNGRVASRLGSDLVDALNMMLLLLPGTPVTYYGEEIGMTNTDISWEDTRDPEGCRWGQDHYKEHSRDPARTPMQWNDGDEAGFTSGNTTWLPINPNYKEINVAAQRNSTLSSLRFYHKLAELRQEETFIKGSLIFPNYNENIFCFMRYLKGHPSYLAVVNTALTEQHVNLHIGENIPLPEEATVVLRSSNNDANHTSSGSTVFLNDLVVTAGGGMVLRLPEE